VPEQSAVTTFFFTDIEGSSRLWETDPSGMQPALAEHDRIVRSAVVDHRGTVVKMTGDGICAVFADPLDAVQAALALQLALAEAKTSHGLPLHARCGMHVGVGERRDNDYFGNAVNRAARIMSAANGGQTLMSQAVVDLVRDRLPDGVSLRDLGAVRLRDLASPERLHQLQHPALRQDFPALRSLAATPNNLPQEMTSFVGRERELEEARRLLASSRLLTLHGAGGIGKTRLSLKLASQVLDEHPDGVWFVELAPIADARLVPQAVASVMGVKEEAGHPVMDALVKHVAELRVLLLLDNCEHLVGACAVLADGLRRASPGVRIVATSREPLHVAGEAVYPVPALAVPNVGEPVDALTQYEAIRLFTERASQASFRLTAANSPAVIDICRRLDGIPLAIELAAARTRALSVENIASRLDHRFRLLTTGNRTALPRQQTLRALIDWSYDLLGAEERALFRRLAVFAGGLSLEAAEAVCAGGDVAGGQIIDLLSALVEKSMLATEAGGERYRLLETMREYAQEQLDESGETEAVRDLHLAFYLALAEEARAGLVGPEQGQWLARLDAERENLLAAHRWCDSATQGADAGLRLVHAIKQYWLNHGLLGLGYRVTCEALERSGAQARNLARCRGLFDAGQISYFMGRYPDAQQRLKESLSIARDIGDRAMAARVLQPLGGAYLGQGDVATARTYLTEAVALARELGDRRQIAGGLNALAQLHRLASDLDAAEPLYEKVVELARELGDRESVAIGLLNLAMVCVGRGASSRARQLLAESLAIAREIGSKALGQSVLEVSAGLGAACSDWTSAARLFGAAEAQMQQSGLHRDPADEAFLAPLVERARREIGQPAFDRDAAQGAALSYEAAVDEVGNWLGPLNRPSS
jgi:predicted ATPase/class 3 adenylate cyclase